MLQFFELTRYKESLVQLNFAIASFKDSYIFICTILLVRDILTAYHCIIATDWIQKSLESQMSRNQSKWAHFQATVNQKMQTWIWHLVEAYHVTQPISDHIFHEIGGNLNTASFEFHISYHPELFGAGSIRVSISIDYGFTDLDSVFSIATIKLFEQHLSWHL